MRRLSRRRHPDPRRSAAGLSLVELLVGITVGLIVVAGASYVAVNQIGDNRRLLLETQVQQDLRAAADLIARDVRRAGYWSTAEQGLWQGDTPALAANAYVAVAPAAASAPVGQVDFTYSRDPAGAEDNAVDDDAERFGFKLEGGAIKMLLGSAWQTLTDTNVLEVTTFAVTAQPQTVRQACYRECAGGGTACWPTETVRTLTIDIAGRAVSDANVVRSVREVVRLRNDAITGACPA